ncbi:ribosome small subunit-dependent GTPase A [Halanaerocella petrolearia]
MQQGRVLKAHGGYFFIYDAQKDKVYQSTIRGRLKKEDIDVIAGDKVEFNILDDGSGVVEERLERENSLFRPPIANVDQVVITVAIANPDLHFKLLDRLLILGKAADLEIIICVNKVDLLSKDKAKEVMVPYEEAGYQVVYTSAQEGLGIDRLKNNLQDKVSVFAGPSGVGKSSLLNAIQPDLELRTGQISKRIKRGRHTTRRVELLSLDIGGWVADTPGFSALDVTFITSRQLQYFFPEMLGYINSCKFSPCSHSHEPDCAVKAAVDQEKIAQYRYNHYLEFLDEIKKAEERDWRR